MTTALIFFGAVFFLVGLAVDPGTTALAFASFGAALMNFGFCGLIWRYDRRYLAYKFFSMYFIVQPLFFLFFVLWFGQEIRSVVAATSLFDQPPFSLFYSFNLIPLMAAIFAWILDQRQQARRLPALAYTGQPAPADRSCFRMPRLSITFDALLIVCALINLSIWFSTVENNFVTAGLRVVYRALLFMPFVAGMYWNRSRLPQLVWIFVLSVNMVFAFFTGSRGYGFFSLGFYALGFIVQQTTAMRRVKWTVVGLAGLIPLVILSGLIRNMRDEFGYVGITNVQFSEVIRNINIAFQESKEASQLTWEEAPNDAVWIGLERLVDWTDVHAPNMSPDIVGYRGYGDFLDEFKSLASFTKLGIFPFWNYPSTEYAQMYGFYVNVDRENSGEVTSSTAVPFNILADAWSRFGLFSALAQVTAALLILTGFEQFLMNRFLPRHMELFVLARTILIGIAANFLTIYTLVAAIREMLITLPVVLAIIGLGVLVMRAVLSEGGEAGLASPGDIGDRRRPLSRPPPPRRGRPPLPRPRRA